MQIEVARMPMIMTDHHIQLFKNTGVSRVVMLKCEARRQSIIYDAGFCLT